MTEFKVGDRVRVIEADPDSPNEKGAVGTVTRGTHPAYALIRVDLEGFPDSDLWYPRQIELLDQQRPEPGATFEQALDQVLAEVRATMIDRHSKYGPGNILRHGEMGVVVRLGDKYERLDHSREVDFADESTDDCVTDIIGYGLILKLLRAKQWPGQS